MPIMVIAIKHCTQAAFLNAVDQLTAPGFRLTTPNQESIRVVPRSKFCSCFELGSLPKGVDQLVAALLTANTMYMTHDIVAHLSSLKGRRVTACIAKIRQSLDERQTGIQIATGLEEKADRAFRDMGESNIVVPETHFKFHREALVKRSAFFLAGDLPSDTSTQTMLSYWMLVYGGGLPFYEGFKSLNELFQLACDVKDTRLAQDIVYRLLKHPFTSADFNTNFDSTIVAIAKKTDNPLIQQQILSAIETAWRPFITAGHLDQLRKDKHCVAQCILGLCYEKGIGVGPDVRHAESCYEKGGDLGKCLLGRLQNNFTFFQQAHSSGNTLGTLLLGECYLNGEGVVRNPATAFELFNLVPHPYSIGRCYEEGLGTQIDLEKAVTCYENAAAQGHIDAMCRLGQLLIRRDTRRAWDCFYAVARMGHPQGMAWIGEFYKHGYAPVEVNKDVAVAWYRASAELGHPLGQIHLAHCYRDGTGVAKNETKAFQLYQKASITGDPLGHYYVGCCYEFGIGISENARQAYKFYKKAADAGFSFGLAHAYELGIGIIADPALAIRYYTEAAGKGSAEAIKALERLRINRT